jgi:FKBP-type peptidyl-prolyl cis-trans isomerase FklB
MTMYSRSSSTSTSAFGRGALAARTAVVALAAVMAGPVIAQTADTAAAAATAASGAGGSAGVKPIVSLKDKMSYSTGVMTARQLIKNDVPFDLDLMILGLKDALAGGEIRISEKELKVVLQSMQADITKKMSNDRMGKASLNRERGIVFQNEYKTKPDVTVLPGNLMYRVIKAGSGDKPGALSTVVVKYRGTLVDGTEVDATPEGKTATIKLENVITGWREALKRMPAGSIWEIVVPTTLAYGTRGAGTTIGPNETLVFNIELVAVVQ